MRKGTAEESQDYAVIKGRLIEEGRWRLSFQKHSGIFNFHILTVVNASLNLIVWSLWLPVMSQDFLDGVIETQKGSIYFYKPTIYNPGTAGPGFLESSNSRKYQYGVVFCFSIDWVTFCLLAHWDFSTLWSHLLHSESEDNEDVFVFKL